MTQPNILFIFTDQMRADAVAAAGNPIIKTRPVHRPNGLLRQPVPDAG